MTNKQIRKIKSLNKKGFNRIIEHLQWEKVAKLMTESYETEIKKMIY